MSKYRHPIYGVKRRVVIQPTAATATSGNTCYEPCPGIENAFIALEAAIFNIERALQQFYQPQRAVSDFIAKMSARCFVPPAILVRLVWRETYTGVKFDITDRIQRLQIKYIYMMYSATNPDFNYRDDPLFKDALGLTLI